ncbi:hypothetical protein FIV00_03690 [Labrenzia sp. THAF82]|uniref:hypothetical protein n=1 Tax=Labrenzia sp. THAF82 TaxID=2587861 RepID=UPI0012687797|nr:hypothetical protein [Labrenzia sp. THAF82]QFT29572.1 hypothetical protein FIV00_03690 [Labrenzia sp. THAF82]
MFKKHLTIIATGAVLAACNPGLPEATDEQLLMLFSEHETMGVAAIHRNAVECLEILSGDSLYVDLGPELRGQLKTNCRQALDKVLQDADRNPVGFTMAHMESPDLTERVKKLRQTQDARIDELREQQRAAKAEQQQLENDALDHQNRKTLKQAKLDAAQYLERAKTFVETMEPKCQELVELQEKKTEREVMFLQKLSLRIYNTCSSYDPKKVSDRFQKNLRSAEEFNARIQAITYLPHERGYFSVPDIEFESDFLAREQAKIEELLSEVKSQIEHNNS